MKRIVWLTDIHLNFVKPADVETYLDEVAAAKPDAVLLSGDISEAHDVTQYLAQMDERLRRPIYFVLGNHDFYFGSIRRVRDAVKQLCAERPNLFYLSDIDPIELTPTIGLVGHDGWADARIGDYERSYVMMNDYRLIEELAGFTKLDRWPVLKAMGDESAAHIRRVLPQALKRYSHVYLATHVPPLREACWHEGRTSDDEWAPHFTCKAMGDAILEIMRNHPHHQLTVLCGHTHGSGETQPQTNVTIYTGGAEYSQPSISRVFQLD